jgi:uroporphyrinogen decarboxylase
LALNHQEADRVPIAFGGPECSIHRQAHANLLNYLGLSASPASILDTCLQIIYPDARLYERFQVDLVWLTPAELRMDWSPERTSYLDEFGRKFRSGGGFYNQIDFPLKEGTLQELSRLVFPNMGEEWRVSGLAEKALALHDQGYGLAADGPWGIYEISSSLRGTENLLTDLVLQPNYAEELAERVLEEHLKPFYALLLNAVAPLVQLVIISDDLGSQENLLFSPAIFRKIYKPRLYRLVEHIRKFTPARVYLHSDGAVSALIPDFIEVGLDGLNPVQYTAKGMESVRLKKEFGQSLGFFGGGIDNQILSTGSVAQVKTEVKRQLHQLALGGGYLFATIHNISQEAPPDNVVAFFDAGFEYGAYPLL